MQIFELSIKNKSTILALGAESAGNFSVYKAGKIYFSEDFGDLLIDANFTKFKRALNKFLRENKIKPEIVITDLHPLYKTTALGQEMAKKYKAKHVQVQHHLAHIFSTYGENNLKSQISDLRSFTGIALDGTGYGSDGNIWGGEIFEIYNSSKAKLSNFPKLSFRRIARIGHLENQTMIGGDSAIKEPARMLISILAKFLSEDKIYPHVKKYYTHNQFEVLWNQLQSGFNCQETSSTGRVLDAVSIFLGFCQNERNFKHEPTILLEQNSTLPYRDLKPKIIKNFNKESGIINYELSTTYLLQYVLKNIHKDKRRLAATAQLYIAQGLYEIIKKYHFSTPNSPIFLAGGIANNKIVSKYLISKGAIVNSDIPRGDAGISLGQIIYFLTNPRH